MMRLASRSTADLAASQGAVRLRFMAAVDNLDHIRLAYGPEVAAAAMERLRDALREWLGDRTELHFERDGILYGTLSPASSLSPAGRGGPDHAAINRLLINPPALLMNHHGCPIVLAISGGWAVNDGSDPTAARPFEGGVRAAFAGEAPGPGEDWERRYRADMALAANVISALEAGPTDARFIMGPRGTVSAGRGAWTDPVASEPLVIGWQPVRDARLGRDILYYEMVPQLCAADGRRRTLDDVRPALERLGLTMALDQVLLELAIDLLDADPDIAVSVPVMAQSICAGPRWGALFRRLNANRSGAIRLTVAISETASFPDFTEAVHCVSRLQSLGCAVAIDNFGLGYTSIRELVALEPDILCIDPFFVGFGGSHVPEGAVLAHLAGLGGLLATTVVVKGIATERQSRLALEAGVTWQQGEFHGGAALGRPRRGMGARGACRLPYRSIRRSRAA